VKTIIVDVDIVETPFEYNFLVGYCWFYTMTIVLSSISHTVFLPHEGNIITIDQIDCKTLMKKLAATGMSMIFFGGDPLGYVNINIHFFMNLSLMSIFLMSLVDIISTIITTINMISSITIGSH